MNGEVLDAVRTVLAPHTTEPRLHAADPTEVSLQSLCIPSVEMIGIVIELEDRFGILIDQNTMFELHTVADLAHALAAAGARP